MSLGFILFLLYVQSVHFVNVVRKSLYARKFPFGRMKHKLFFCNHLYGFKVSYTFAVKPGNNHGHAHDNEHHANV